MSAAIQPRGPTLPKWAVAFLAVAPVLAPDPAEGQQWEARLAYEHQLIDSDLPHWSDWRFWRLEARRDFGPGNVALELLRHERFGRTDLAGAVDLYVDVLERTWVHARTQLATDAEVMPEQDHRIGIHHATRSGWEGGVDYRHMAFDRHPDVGVWGASMARYLPGWYLRVDGNFNPSLDADALFVSAAARRFLPALDGHVQLSAGAGEELVEVRAGPIVEIRGSRAIGMDAKLFPYARAGLAARLAYLDLDDLPGRLAAGASIILRW